MGAYGIQCEQPWDFFTIFLFDRTGPFLDLGLESIGGQPGKGTELGGKFLVFCLGDHFRVDKAGLDDDIFYPNLPVSRASHVSFFTTLDPNIIAATDQRLHGAKRCAEIADAIRRRLGRGNNADFAFHRPVRLDDAG